MKINLPDLVSNHHNVYFSFHRSSLSPLITWSIEKVSFLIWVELCVYSIQRGSFANAPIKRWLMDSLNFTKCLLTRYMTSIYWKYYCRSILKFPLIKFFLHPKNKESYLGIWACETYFLGSRHISFPQFCTTTLFCHLCGTTLFHAPHLLPFLQRGFAHVNKLMDNLCKALKWQISDFKLFWFACLCIDPGLV